MGFFFSLLINGSLVGVMYSLVALGFVVTYKSTGAFNVAGEVWKKCVKMARTWYV